ncbi:MAG: DUF721 domain-containing protein [Chloroherpetonaceae bacterium]|nr:DUF721 domain-containing protein [Chloroherpetonaceae bacterium]MCS7211289.1 DUF721 domain-containing protein [Chloroherpetonaceae bacterium]MDW8019709.1 DUF721 domain-containing protein [Chloroherpetonaceae bacterium]
MPYTKAPNRFEVVLDALYGELHFNIAAEEFKAIRLWREVVGSHIARVSEVEKIVDGILHVKVKNSAWRNELTFRKQSIIHQLNHRIGSPFVRDIVFK